MFRRLFRRFFPRLSDPWLDTPAAPLPRDGEIAAAYLSALLPEQRQELFLTARYDEGRRWREVLRRAGVSSGRVLDIGSGAGGVSLALAAAGLVAVTADSVWNDSLRRAFRAARLPMRHVIADAAALPFRGGAFDAMVHLETLEHLPQPERAGAEASRVLRHGATIVLITPARLAWIFRRDPHFAIPFLILFPPSLQRWIAASRGHGGPHDYVDRIYNSSRAIERLFSDCRIEHTLTRSRLPKRWFWDALVLRKG
jgi:SAM-dependent methyltransferase